MLAQSNTDLFMIRITDTSTGETWFEAGTGQSTTPRLYTRGAAISSLKNRYANIRRNIEIGRRHIRDIIPVTFNLGEPIEWT